MSKIKPVEYRRLENTESDSVRVKRAGVKAFLRQISASRSLRRYLSGFCRGLTSPLSKIFKRKLQESPPLHSFSSARSVNAYQVNISELKQHIERLTAMENIASLLQQPASFILEKHQQAQQLTKYMHALNENVEPVQNDYLLFLGVKARIESEETEIKNLLKAHIQKTDAKSKKAKDGPGASYISDTCNKCLEIISRSSLDKFTGCQTFRDYQEIVYRNKSS